MMITDIGGICIDFTKVCSVGPLGGEANWRRYTVTFVGGTSLKAFETRKDCAMRMRRRDFIKLWKESKEEE